MHAQPCQHGDEQRSQFLRSAAMASSASEADVTQRLCFLFVRRVGKLFGRLFEVSHDDGRRRLVCAMKRQQLVHHVTAIESAGVMKKLPSGDHLKDRSRHSVGDAAANVSRVNAL